MKALLIAVAALALSACDVPDDICIPAFGNPTTCGDAHHG